jgi:hypothetical protein
MPAHWGAKHQGCTPPSPDVEAQKCFVFTVGEEEGAFIKGLAAGLPKGG